VIHSPVKYEVEKPQEVKGDYKDGKYSDNVDYDVGQLGFKPEYPQAWSGSTDDDHSYWNPEENIEGWEEEPAPSKKNKKQKTNY
jgi:hypothetical protein